MKPLLAVGLLVVLVGTPAFAQLGGSGRFIPPQPPVQPSNPVGESNASLELMALEQEVDKTLYREALLLVGNMALRPSPELAGDKEEKVLRHLQEFIEQKKLAIQNRAVAINKVRAEASQARQTQATPRAVSEKSPTSRDEKQALFEKSSETEVEIQLLLRQTALVHQSLSEAVEALANAELAASLDESKKTDLIAPKKQYEKTKALYVELNKRLQTQQSTYSEIQQQQGLGFGGMGGMGGGFR